MVEDTLINEYNGIPANVNKMHRGFMRKYLYDEGHRFFNAGIMRLNLSDTSLDNSLVNYNKFREETEFKGTGPDQDFINFLLKDKIIPLPLSYNFHCWGKNLLTDEGKILRGMDLDQYASEINQIIKNEVFFLHYAFRAAKPWAKPNPKEKNNWHLYMPKFWNSMVKETPNIDERFLLRVKEVDEFVNEFIFQPRTYKKIPLTRKIINARKTNPNDIDLTSFI